MEPGDKPEEKAIIDMIYQLKNPLTNINLCIEMVESGAPVQSAAYYHSIMKESAVKMEQAIRNIVASFNNPGFSAYMAPDLSEID